MVEEGSLPGELVQGQVYAVKALLANNTDRDLKLQVPQAQPFQSPVQYGQDALVAEGGARGSSSWLAHKEKLSQFCSRPAIQS